MGASQQRRKMAASRGSRRRPEFDALEGRALLSTYGLTPTFAYEGIDDLPTRGVVEKADAVAVQTDGKILVAGSTAAAGPSPDFSVTRYNADGTQDSTFTPAQVAFALGGTDDRVHAIAVAPDGTVVLAGSATRADGSTVVALARLNPDGTRDAAFGDDGLVTISFDSAADQSAFFVAALPGGQLVVAGSDTTATAPDQHSVDLDIARIDGDGSLASKTSSTFGYYDTDGLHQDTQSIYEFHAAAVAPGGDLVVVGDINYVGPLIAQPAYTPVVLRFGADGNPDPTFANRGQANLYTLDPGLISDRGRGVAVGPDGSIVLGVAAVNPTNVAGLGPSGRFAAARLTPAGALDGTFGAGGVATASFPGTTNASVAAVAILPDGRVALAGQVADFATANPYLDAGLAILTPAGLPDPSFGNIGEPGTSTFDYYANFDVAASDGISVLPDGTLLVSGLLEASNTDSFTGHANGLGLAKINPAESTADDAFLTSLFQTYVHRNPTAGELAGRLEELQYYEGLGNFHSQSGRFLIAQQISQTPEALGDLVNGLYETYLRRPADAGAIAGFTQYLQGGGTQQGLAAIILGSGEYFADKDNSNTSYVIGLYQDLFGRTPTVAEIQGWMTQIGAAGRQSVAAAFLSSEEFRYDTIASYYQAPAGTALPVLLKRPSAPTYGEVSGWQGSTYDLDTIQYFFAQSVEYFVNG